MTNTRRPDPALLTYYALTSLALGPFFIFALVPYYFRYHTMRYIVEDEGITMRWGILYRREISLTYARIQDIHLVSNFVERWLGLARIQVQTASGNSGAEMTIEGLPDYEALRDFLYERMRGARNRPVAASHPSSIGHDEMRELTEALNEIAAEVRAIHRALPAPRVEVEGA